MQRRGAAPTEPYLLSAYFRRHMVPKRIGLPQPWGRPFVFPLRPLHREVHLALSLLRLHLSK